MHIIATQATRARGMEISVIRFNIENLFGSILVRFFYII
jgi:hypothetical protein